MRSTAYTDDWLPQGDDAFLGLPFGDRCGLGGVEAAGRPSGPTPAPTLPCLNINNSNDELLTAANRKCAFALVQNVHHFVEFFGLNSVCMLTITAVGEAARDMRAFQKLWNSFSTGALRARYSGYIMVMERSDSDRVHAHLLVPIGEFVEENGARVWRGVDVRSGYNWEVVKCRNYRSVCSVLKREWAWLRRKVVAYGFGAWVNMEPLRTNSEAVSRYVGKYIGKHVSKRLAEDKGVRLVRYSRVGKVCNCKFSFASVCSFLWRRKQCLVAEKLRVLEQNFVRGPYVGEPFPLVTYHEKGRLPVANPGELRASEIGEGRNVKTNYFGVGGFACSWGSRWAFYSREAFQFLKLAVYPTKKHAEADGFDVRELPDDSENCVVYSKGAIALEWASAEYLRDVFSLSKEVTVCAQLVEMFREDEWGPSVPDAESPGHLSSAERYRLLMRAIRSTDW